MSKRPLHKKLLVPVILAVATVLVGASSLGGSVALAATKTIPFGLYQASNNLQYSFPVTPEQAIEYLGWSTSGTNGFPTTNANAVYTASGGKTAPFVELQSCDSSSGTSTGCASTDPGFALPDIANGVYDTSLTAFNTAAQSYGHTVYLTFDHEMNGSWYPWGTQNYTTAQWIAAWDHVVSVINATNVKWVWAPNINVSSYHPLTGYWPGATHVGLCGIDGYLGPQSATWANTIAPSVASLKSTCGTKKWELAETGVDTADSNAVAQIDDLMSNTISSGATYAIYFDKYQWIFTTPTQTEFQKYIH